MPKKPKRQRKTVINPNSNRLIQARVPDSLFDRIVKAAQAETITISAYVRRTLQNTVPGG